MITKQTEYLVLLHTKAEGELGYSAYEFTFPFYPIDSDIEWLKERVVSYNDMTAQLISIVEKVTTWS